MVRVAEAPLTDVLMDVKLEPIDWAFIVGYCVIAFGIGIYFTKRASANMENFFLAGRKLPWWLAGTSIVATSFAADTPLVVSGLIRNDGVYKNWLWWYVALAGMMCVFFYAKLWRRAGLLTDISFIELRYGGKPAAALRGFYSVYHGLIANSIVMGSVMLAMMKVTQVVLGLESDTDNAIALGVLLLVALGYTLLSGFWGVVVTDLLQFVIAMIGAIIMAGYVLVEMGGPAAMVEQIKATEAFEPKVLDLIPNPNHVSQITMISFVILVSASWWGEKAQGNGYLAQRLLATKDERHALLAALWFNVAHYVLRPWPWIIVGLASLVYFPIVPGEDPELAYPMMMAKLLPAGLLGLLVASFLAAFMSTMDTHMNWGASYIVNDLYKRFIYPNGEPKHYVMVSRLACVVIALLAALVAWQSTSIKAIWIYLMLLGAGGGILMLLRWFWWRINAWAEISAMAGSLLIANGKFILQGLAAIGLFPRAAMPTVNRFYSGELWAVRGLCLVIICTGIWLIVMFLTKPTRSEHLERFYRRVRPGGWWGPIARRCSDVQPDGGLGYRWLGWLTGVVGIYASLLGIGNLCLGHTGTGLMFLAGAVIAGYFCLRAVDATTQVR